MPDPLSAISTRRTVQSVQADPRQVKNSAGGYTFQIDDEARLRRFLVLGTDGPSYYAASSELTRDNADVVLRMAATQPRRLVDVIVEISLAGRAPKQHPTIFALAIAAAAPTAAEDRRYALDQLGKVCRTGTHLFLFMRYVQQFRGWGTAAKRAVADWYLDKPVTDVAYQAVKYRSREDWSHRDVLRTAHPGAKVRHGGRKEKGRRHQPGRVVSVEQKALFDWIAGRGDAEGFTTVQAWKRAQAATTPREWAELVQVGRLSWEMLPDAALGHAQVWEALLDQGMGMTALIRQLPRLTNLGMLSPLGDRTSQVAARLTDRDQLKKARIHPVNALVALRTYASGHGARSSLSWTPSRPIVDALDEAFYLSFDMLEPTGKRTLLALDVSGSMAMSTIANMPLTPREASAAMAMATARTESRWEAVGFTGNRGGWGRSSNTALTPLAISPRQRLDDVIRAVSDLPFGTTDCALPMVWALKQRKEIDCFCIYTDNETWVGDIHPHQALVEYRQKMGIDAKLVVVSMTPTRFSIADPADPGMLDVAGFDSAVPQLIADFSRGL